MKPSTSRRAAWDAFMAVPEWAWLALALTLRAGFALMLDGRLYQTDESGFLSIARTWSETWVVGQAGQASVAPPVPAVFFGTFLRLGGGLVWPRLAQSVVGAFAAVLVGRMAGSLTGSARSGRAALAVACVYPFFIYYSGMLLSETLYIALSVAGLWALCETLRDGARERLGAGAGTALALAALCRAECAPISAALWLIALGAAAARRRGARALLTGLACWAVILGSWGLRNRGVCGRFTLDTHGGMALMHGTVLFDLNEQDTGVAMRALEKTPLYREAQLLGEAERDQLFTRTALRFMLDHPGRTLIQWAQKTLSFWRFYPRVDKPYDVDARRNPSLGLGRGVLVAISLLFEPALILGGLFGLWTLLRRSRETWPLPSFVLLTMAVHVVSVSQMRYRLPVMPPLIVGAAGLIRRRP